MPESRDSSAAAIIFVAVVVLTIIIVVYFAINYLHGVVNLAEIVPVDPCVAWLERRRKGYLGGRGLPLMTDPATGQPFTKCGAVSRAVEDSQTASGGVCPVVSTSLPVGRQAPYTTYMSARLCPARPD